MVLQIVRMKTFSNIIFCGINLVALATKLLIKAQKMFRKDICLKNLPTWISKRIIDILDRRKLVWLKWDTWRCRKQKKFIWWTASMDAEKISEVLEVLCSFTLKLSRVKSHNFFSFDEKSHDFSCEKWVSCDFTWENLLRVIKNYTILHVNECMRKWSNFL